jgi:hypothetical protein
MPTDYVLFIHGVNTRQPTYADQLIEKLKSLSNPATSICPLVVFWGDVADDEEATLLYGYQASDIWKQLWFTGLRERLLLSFAGDLALYLSRYIGARVAARVAEQIARLRDCTAEDRLHLVTHSLGTVVLFDLLFSSRWDDESASGHDDVMAIRNAIYGVTGSDPDPRQGIRLGSITTMGSPIGIFTLTDVDVPSKDISSDPSKATSTHDITPSLVKLLDYLHQELGGSKLPWSNFVHPGDAIASPLEEVLPAMIDGERTYIDFQDILVPLAQVFKDPIKAVLMDRTAWLLSKTSVSVLDTANAHNSYWRSSRVSEGITQSVRQARASRGLS